MIKCINKIKTYSLNDRLFRALCHDNEDFERYSLHTPVRWLLKGACITRLYSLYDSVVEFLSGIDCQSTEAVKPLKNNIACLADIFSFMIEVNKKLRSEMITLIRCKSMITSSISKLSLYKENMGRNILSQYPNPCGNDITENERLKYCSHLHNLVEDMHICFAGLVNFNVPKW